MLVSIKNKLVFYRFLIFVCLFSFLTTSCRLNDNKIKGTISGSPSDNGVLHGIKYSIELSPDGSESGVVNFLTPLNSTTTFFAVKRNNKNEFISNAPVSWSLEGSIGNLNIVGDGKSAEFVAKNLGVGDIRIFQGGIEIASIKVNCYQENKLELLNISFSNIVSDGFNAKVNYQGDNNLNGSVNLYFCNWTDSPGCDPAIESPVSMSRVDQNFETVISGLSSPNDPGDTLKLIAIPNDPEGTLGTSKLGEVILIIPSLGSFNITGVTASAGDNNLDSYLVNSLTPKISWQSSLNALSYDVEILNDTEDTVVCPVQNTTNLYWDFSSCNLTAGNFYKASVIAKVGFDSKSAMNNLYRFYVNRSPILGSDGGGPWYVMSGGSLNLDVNWTPSPGTGVASDAEGDSMVFSVVNNGSLGVVTNNSNSFSYIPIGNNSGVDTIAVTITDDKGGILNTTITIHVMKPYTWTGSTSSAWNTNSNWCGTIVSTDKRSCAAALTPPTSADTIYFDNTCTSSFTCTPTTPSNKTFEGVVIKSNGFNQGAGFTLDIGASGWIQSGGSFIGSDSNINLLGDFNISGGVFTSTSGLLISNYNFSITNTPTFNNNNGIVRFSGLSNGTITSGGVAFKDVEFIKSGGSSSTITLLDDFSILGNLYVDKTGSYTPTILPSGVRIIDLYGNIDLKKTSGAAGAILGNPNLTIRMSGSTDQTLTQTGSIFAASMVFNKPSGRTKLNSDFEIQGDFTLDPGQVFDVSPDLGITQYKPSFGKSFTNNGGALILRNAPVRFSAQSNGTILSGGMNFNNVEFIKSGGSASTVTLLDDFTIFGNLFVDTIGSYRPTVLPSGTRTINLHGNIDLKHTAGSAGAIFGNSNLSVRMVGSSDQTLTQTGSTFAASMIFNKPSGITKLNSDFEIRGDFTLDPGQVFDVSPDSGITQYKPIFGSNYTFNGGTFLLRNSPIQFSGFSSCSILTGGMIFNDVEFIKNGGSTSVITLVDDFTVLGSLYVDTIDTYRPSILPSGTRVVDLHGNIDLKHTAGSAGAIFGNSNLSVRMVGSSDQTLTQTGSSFNANMIVNKSTGNLNLNSNFNMNASGQIMSFQNGNGNMNGWTFDVLSLSLNGNILNKGAGSLIVNSVVQGTGSLFGGTVNP